MNSLVCPTDFSVTANNAVHYASQLAEFLNTKIILVNVLHVPAVDVYSPANVMSEMMDAQRQGSKVQLEALIEELQDKYECSYEYRIEFGFAAEVICEIANENRARLISMGTNGSSMAINRFLGSVSYETVKRSEVPVLVVPADCEFKRWDKIVVANDQKESLKDEMAELGELSKYFESAMDIVTVEKDDDTPYEIEVKNIKGKTKVVEIESTKVAPSICRYVDENDIKLLALKRHQRSFLENLFHKSTIKQVLGKSNIPALVFN
ncbi:MAG: universal stress protein [Bacteroidia bacterium]